MSDPKTPDNSEVREIRINPIVPSESVLVATARSMRPKKAEELAPRDTRKHVETCPFCRGNEHKTPPVILHWPPEGDWQIRMVENLYPVLGDDSFEKSKAIWCAPDKAKAWTDWMTAGKAPLPVIGAPVAKSAPLFPRIIAPK